MKNILVIITLIFCFNILLTRTNNNSILQQEKIEILSLQYMSELGHGKCDGIGCRAIHQWCLYMQNCVGGWDCDYIGHHNYYEYPLVYHDIDIGTTSLPYCAINACCRVVWHHELGFVCVECLEYYVRYGDSC